MTPAQEQAILAAGHSLYLGRGEVVKAANEGGPEAVARQAKKNGTDEEIAALAAYYQRLHEQAIKGSAA